MLWLIIHRAWQKHLSHPYRIARLYPDRNIEIDYCRDISAQTPAAPVPGNTPAMTVFPVSGNLVFRSEWYNTDAVYMHMLCEDEDETAVNGGGHEHPDITSFSIMAGTEVLAMDPGIEGGDEAGDQNKPQHHNLILVGNKDKGPDKKERGYLDGTFNLETSACFTKETGLCPATQDSFVYNRMEKKEKNHSIRIGAGYGGRYWFLYSTYTPSYNENRYEYNGHALQFFINYRFERTFSLYPEFSLYYPDFNEKIELYGMDILGNKYLDSAINRRIHPLVFSGDYNFSFHKKLLGTYFATGVTWIKMGKLRQPLFNAGGGLSICYEFLEIRAGYRTFFYPDSMVDQWYGEDVDLWYLPQVFEISIIYSHFFKNGKKY